MKPAITILLLGGVLFASKAWTQAPLPCRELPLPQEHVMLNLDRNICLAGETVWFKAWCFLDGQLDREMSQVLYIEVFDENEKAIVQEKFLLKGNQASGAIRIPEDVPGKYYFLKAYTRYMRNFSVKGYHYQQLIIINPFFEQSTVQVEEARPEMKPTKAFAEVETGFKATHEIRIESGQKKYKPREAISLSFSSRAPLSAEISVVVRLKGLGNQPAQEVLRLNPWLQTACQRDPFCGSFSLPGSKTRATVKTAVEEETFSGPLQWLPETRGLTISGYIQNDDITDLGDIPAVVAVVQDLPMIHMVTTDNQGAFTVPLQNMQQAQNLFIGTPDATDTVLIRKDFDPDFPEIAPVPLPFDTVLHQLLEGLHLHQQLQQAFSGKEFGATYSPDLVPVPATNLLAPDRRILLADYIEMPAMEEVFREIATGVALRKTAGSTGLSVFDENRQQWLNSPLVLLDNVPVFDIEELLKISPAEVEAIEVFDSDYILGDYTIGGIVSIHTKTDDFAGYQWGKQVAFVNFKAYAAPEEFQQTLPALPRHYPDFRPVLYWQPDLRFQEGAAVEAVRLYAPDRPGQYEILVAGFTDSGRPCFGYETFEVIH